METKNPRPATRTGRRRAPAAPALALAAALPSAAVSAQGLPVGPDGLAVINLEIDYMVEAGGHSHEPRPDEIDALVQMFACHGITLNVVVDDAIPHQDLIACPGDGQNFWSCLGPQSFALIKATYFDSPSFGWHYCVFGHQYVKDDGTITTSSGRAEIGGNDLIVTLGGFDGEIGTPFDRAATLAHELGHNLGLNHWSNDSFFELGAYSPNYASVMSYQYQLEGVRSQMECLGLVGSLHSFRQLDYSDGRLPQLLDFQLDERVGVGLHSTDFDCDGAVDDAPVSVGLDDDTPWCGEPSGGLPLYDHDDWSNLVDSTWSLPADEPYPWETVDCITYEEVLALRAADDLADPSSCPGSQPTLAVEPCTTQLMTFADPTYTGLFSTGDGDHPYKSLESAQILAPAGSLVFLQPATYTSANPSVVLDKRMTYSSPVPAVVDP